MSWDQRLYLQDAIDARRSTVAKTRKALEDKANAHISWSYARTEDICWKSPGGLLSYGQARSCVDGLKHDVGRANNVAATNLLHPYFSRMAGRFYPVEKERYRIGVDPKGFVISCQTRVLGLLHNGEIGTLYWINYRKSGRLDNSTAGLIATVFNDLYLVDPEYQGSRFKIVDVSAPPSGNRVLQEFAIEDLELWPQEDMASFFDPIYMAIRQMREDGFSPRPRAKKQKPIDPNQPQLL